LVQNAKKKVLNLRVSFRLVRCSAATSFDEWGGSGGGLLIDGLSREWSKQEAVLDRVVFVENRALNKGGALWIFVDNVDERYQLTDVTFCSNRVVGEQFCCGGMSLDGKADNVVLENVLFDDNTVASGVTMNDWMQGKMRSLANCTCSYKNVPTST
jgi:hypothetical protein